MTRSRFGMIGLGTMGRNLALNIESRGVPVAVCLAAFSTRFAAARASRLRFPRTMIRAGAMNLSEMPRSSATGS